MGRRASVWGIIRKLGYEIGSGNGAVGPHETVTGMCAGVQILSDCRS